MYKPNAMQNSVFEDARHSTIRIRCSSSSMVRTGVPAMEPLGGCNIRTTPLSGEVAASTMPSETCPASSTIQCRCLQVPPYCTDLFCVGF